MALNVVQIARAHEISYGRFFGSVYTLPKSAVDWPVLRAQALERVAGGQALRAALGEGYDLASLEYATAMLMFGYINNEAGGAYCEPWLTGPNNTPDDGHRELAISCASELGVSGGVLGDGDFPNPDCVQGIAARTVRPGSAPRVAFLGTDFVNRFSDMHKQAIGRLAAAMPDVSYLVADAGGLRVNIVANTPPAQP